jgi:hypothetical protein
MKLSQFLAFILIFKAYINIILSSFSRSFKLPFSFSFFNQTAHTFLCYPCMTRGRTISFSFHFITWPIFGEFLSWSSPLHGFLQPRINSSFLHLHVLLSRYFPYFLYVPTESNSSGTYWKCNFFWNWNYIWPEQIKLLLFYYYYYYYFCIFNNEILVNFLL